MFKIPYSLLPTNTLRKASHAFFGMGEYLKKFFPFLKLNLKQAEVDFSVKEYLSMCFLSDLIFFIFIGFFITSILFAAVIEDFLLIGLIITILITLFVFFQQVSYPKVYSQRRVRGIERNLIPALQNILVQLNSGIPLFNILVNVSKSNYGEISKEFFKAVKEINAGRPQIETLEEMAAINPSLFFRRGLWQIVSGMKSGADLSSVINEIINSLSEEQILQIQRYGSQLNPLAMFYMLIVVIVPSLGMTFLIILTSFIPLTELITRIIFWGLYALILFLQIMFIGVIKSKRPNLLSE